MIYDSPIAVLPVENLSRTVAPLEKIKDLMIDRLKERGFTILEEESLEIFMKRHRLRYTGGIDDAIAMAFDEEVGTKAVVITSLEYYSENYPPKISIISRLVFTEGGAKIVWMDSIGMSGDSSRGILDLGLVRDPNILLGKAMKRLSDSLADHLIVEKEIFHEEMIGSRYRPKRYFRSPGLDFKLGSQFSRPNVGSPFIFGKDRPHGASAVQPIVVVVPFFNLSSRKNAGDILSLHFVKSLQDRKRIFVVEPGEVRSKLLDLRIIMEDGISLSHTDLIFDKLRADFILTGRVFDYQDYEWERGKVKVDFSVTIIQRENRKVVWYSRSYNDGDDGVYFFDWGLVRNASELTIRMADSAVNLIVNGKEVSISEVKTVEEYRKQLR